MRRTCLSLLLVFVAGCAAGPLEMHHDVELDAELKAALLDLGDAATTTGAARFDARLRGLFAGDVDGSGATDGQALTWNNSTSTWEPGSGGSGTDLSGLGTDNRLARWDGTDTLQTSAVTESDGGELSGTVYWTLDEVSDPGVPGADTIRLWAETNALALAKDNGTTYLTPADGGADGRLSVGTATGLGDGRIEANEFLDESGDVFLANTHKELGFSEDRKVTWSSSTTAAHVSGTADLALSRTAANTLTIDDDNSGPATARVIGQFLATGDNTGILNQVRMSNTDQGTGSGVAVVGSLTNSSGTAFQAVLLELSKSNTWTSTNTSDADLYLRTIVSEVETDIYRFRANTELDNLFAHPITLSENDQGLPSANEVRLWAEDTESLGIADSANEFFLTPNGANGEVALGSTADGRDGQLTTGILDLSVAESNSVASLTTFTRTDPGTSSDNDLIRHSWEFEDDAGTTVEGFRMDVVADDVSNGAVDTEFVLEVMENGVLNDNSLVIGMGEGDVDYVDIMTDDLYLEIMTDGTTRRMLIGPFIYFYTDQVMNGNFIRQLESLRLDASSNSGTVIDGDSSTDGILLVGTSSGDASGGLGHHSRDLYDDDGSTQVGEEVSGTTNLADASATEIVRLPVSQGAGAGGRAWITVTADDGTDLQQVTEKIDWSVVNKGGTITSAITEHGDTDASSTGTFTLTWSITEPVADTIAINVNADTSLTDSDGNLVAEWEVSSDTSGLSPQ